MNASRLVRVVFDFIELILRWLLVWFAVFIVVFVLFLMGADVVAMMFTVGPHAAVIGGALVITLYGALAFAAMTDLIFRVKGTRTLFARFKESRAADTIVSAIFASERHIVSGLKRTTILAGLLLGVCFLGLAAYLLYKGMAALPISTAIIIAAVIIAVAIGRN